MAGVVPATRIVYPPLLVLPASLAAATASTDYGGSRVLQAATWVARLSRLKPPLSLFCGRLMNRTRAPQTVQPRATPCSLRTVSGPRAGKGDWRSWHREPHAAALCGPTSSQHRRHLHSTARRFGVCHYHSFLGISKPRTTFATTAATATTAIVKHPRCRPTEGPAILPLAAAPADNLVCAGACGEVPPAPWRPSAGGAPGTRSWTL